MLPFADLKACILAFRTILNGFHLQIGPEFLRGGLEMSSGWWLNQTPSETYARQNGNLSLNFRDENSKQSLSCHHLENVMSRFNFILCLGSFLSKKKDTVWLVGCSISSRIYRSVQPWIWTPFNCCIPVAHNRLKRWSFRQVKHRKTVDFKRHGRD